MHDRKNRLFLILLAVLLINGLAGICSCSEDAGNESGNVTRTDWAGLRNTDKSVVENIDLNLSINDPGEEDKIEYYTDRVIEKINSSFSYDTSENTEILKKDLFMVIMDPDNDYLGPLSGMENFTVSVFKTTYDPLISNPAYLSREYVVKYNITFSRVSEKSRIEDTILWYEYDATKVVKKLYDMDFGDNIAVVVIDLIDSSTGKYVRFVLEAEDLEKVRPFWAEDESFIRYYDWSGVFTDNNEIIFCEDPSTGIDVTFKSSLNGEQALYQEINENLKSEIKNQIYEVVRNVDAINRNVTDCNTEGVISSSEDLVGNAYHYRLEIQDYPADDELQPLIDEYLAGLASFSKVGSHFWYKSRMLKELVDNESDAYLLEGMERVNNVLENIGEENYDPFNLLNKALKEEDLFYPAGTAFHYMDSGKNNDISIKITGHYLKSKMLVKDLNGYEYRSAAPGNIYIAVVVDITHLGYRGGGSDKIVTPEPGAYRLYYNGEEYKPLTVDYDVQDMGVLYEKKTLGRKERHESLLLFEIKDYGWFDPENGYVIVDLGDYGERAWSLSEDEDDVNGEEFAGLLTTNLGWLSGERIDAEPLQSKDEDDFSECLPAGTAFHYRDSRENNDISIKITDHYLNSKLLLEKIDGSEYQEAAFGNKFIAIVVDIRHLGYRGGGTETITTPEKSAFTFSYNGEEYEPLTIEYRVRNIGVLYEKTKLDRKERYESLLLFEMKDDKQFDPKMGYLIVDLGDYGKKVWSLSRDQTLE